MKIKVKEDLYEIEKDPYCWIVSKWATVEKGKTKGQLKKRYSTYHANLTQLSSYLVEKAILLPEDATDIKKALKSAIMDVQEAVSKEISK